MSDWQVTEPGVLSLMGTCFRIVYSPVTSGYDFCVYQGDRFRRRSQTVGDAQFWAEFYQRDLVKMGLSESE